MTWSLLRMMSLNPVVRPPDVVIRGCPGQFIYGHFVFDSMSSCIVL